MDIINDIIGLDVYTQNGRKLSVTSIKGSPRKGALIEDINGTWTVVGMDEQKEGC